MVERIQAERRWVECDRCGKVIPPDTFSDLRSLVTITRTWTERFIRWVAVSHRPASSPRGPGPSVLESHIHLCEDDWDAFLSGFLGLGRPKAAGSLYLDEQGHVWRRTADDRWTDLDGGTYNSPRSMLAPHRFALLGAMTALAELEQSS